MIRINFKKYLLYMIRWQLSTPILAVALIWFSTMSKLMATVIANFIGGLIFFWVDMFIFTSRKLAVEWEVKDNIICSDCRHVARGYRIIKTPNYHNIQVAI